MERRQITVCADVTITPVYYIRIVCCTRQAGRLAGWQIGASVGRVTGAANINNIKLSHENTEHIWLPYARMRGKICELFGEIISSDVAYLSDLDESRQHVLVECQYIRGIVYIYI